jgi:hypothetical protein
MRSFRFALSLGVTFALLTSVLVSSALSAQTASVTPASWSVDKVVDTHGGWGSHCYSDGCDMEILQLAHIPEAALGEGADVVVQVTLDLKTTMGSYALIDVDLDPAAVGLLSMRPSSFPVSAPERTTTTLRYVRHNVEPAEGGYDVQLEALLRGYSDLGSKTVRASGEKMTVHVSVTP